MLIALLATMPTVHVSPKAASFTSVSEILATHGHSHAPAESTLSALLSHGHDVAEHEHGVAAIAFPAVPQARLYPCDEDCVPPSLEPLWIVFRIDRPPRV